MLNNAIPCLNNIERGECSDCCLYYRCQVEESGKVRVSRLYGLAD